MNSFVVDRQMTDAVRFVKVWWMGSPTVEEFAEGIFVRYRWSVDSDSGYQVVSRQLSTADIVLIAEIGSQAAAQFQALELAMRFHSHISMTDPYHETGAADIRVA